MNGAVDGVDKRGRHFNFILTHIVDRAEVIKHKRNRNMRLLQIYEANVGLSSPDSTAIVERTGKKEYDPNDFNISESIAKVELLFRRTVTSSLVTKNRFSYKFEAQSDQRFVQNPRKILLFYIRFYLNV